MDINLVTVLLQWGLGLIGIGVVGIFYMALKIREISTDIKYQGKEIKALWTKHDELDGKFDTHVLTGVTHA